MDVHAAALETTLAAREAGGESARRALEAAKVVPKGVLADHFDAAAGFEKALDAALGSALEAPVLESRAALDAALDAVREKKLGAARFVHPLPETPFPEKPKDPRVLGIARELLTAKSARAPASALPDALVVANVDDALALAARHPGRTLVTKDGVVVRGAVVEAAGTEVPGEGLFTVRRDLVNLATERKGIVAKQAAADAEIGSLAEEVGAFAATLDAALAAKGAAERAHSEAEAMSAAARTEEERAVEDLRVLAEEGDALRQDLAKAGESRAEAARLAAQRQSEMATVERTLSELETALDSTRSRRLADAEADAAARNGRDVLAERSRSLASVSAAAEERARDAARRVAELADALVEIGRRRAEALAAGEAARKAQETAAIAAAGADRASHRRGRGGGVAARGARRRGDAGRRPREALDAVRRARFEAELALERHKADQDHLAETCRAEFGCLPAELPAFERTDEEAALAPEALEAALSEDVASRSQALERLGPVNHAALEEYEVESRRLAELSAQKADLDASLAQILETDPDDQHDLVGALPGGLRGRQLQLRRRSSSACSAAGRPRCTSSTRRTRWSRASRSWRSRPASGTRRSSCCRAARRRSPRSRSSSRSSSIKPSPFCILDEVDAPLDEANIDRFNVAPRASCPSETQFILITHNKRTMETAQALYGVTQEEPGVSKLVSVRFD